MAGLVLFNFYFYLLCMLNDQVTILQQQQPQSLNATWLVVFAKSVFEMTN